jgi:HPt (histidine-containing phosphotransfer) domain-containing protein
MHIDRSKLNTNELRLLIGKENIPKTLNIFTRTITFFLATLEEQSMCEPELFQRAVHQMKSSAKQLGLTELAEIASKILAYDDPENVPDEDIEVLKEELYAALYQANAFLSANKQER